MWGQVQRKYTWWKKTCQLVKFIVGKTNDFAWSMWRQQPLDVWSILSLTTTIPSILLSLTTTSPADTKPAASSTNNNIVVWTRNKQGILGKTNGWMMDWESVLDHVERRRQLDLSPDEEEVFDKAENNNKESARKEKESQTRKQLNHSDSMETQVTRYGRESWESITIDQKYKNAEIQEYKIQRKKTGWARTTAMAAPMIHLRWWKNSLWTSLVVNQKSSTYLALC